MNIEMNIDSNRPKIKKSRPSAANILVLGDFSGKGPSDTAAAASAPGVRNMFTLDPNKLDSAVARIAPTIELALDDETHTIAVTSMECFHPDSLLQIDSLFRSAPSVAKEPLEQAAPPEEQAAAGDNNDFARLLGGTTASPGAASPAVKSTLDKLIADAVATDAPAPSTAKERPTGDNSTRLREVLHARPFQQLESAWRSLQWLGERIDYDESASIWLVDVDTSTIESWSEELLRQVAAGPGSAAAIVVLHDYSAAEQSNLQALARLAGGLNTIAFAGTADSLAGLQGDASKSTALDASDFTKPEENAGEPLSGLSNIALGYPNVLLRQPYGKRSDPVDAFDFDELAAAPAHDAFSWGSASIVLALMWLTKSLLVDDAPLVTYDDGSGQAIKPPTGAYMTDSAAEALLARGLVPLLAKRGGTDIRVPRLQSLAITAI
jgi:type VI secretion system protein ImpC